MNFRIRVFSKSTCKTSFDSFGSLLGWYNFTTLRATGKNGPVSAAGYKGTLLQEVHVLNGVQEWQVPITGKYSVEACGASGGDGILPKKGGKGAKVSGVITLSKGDKLAILVGQKGSTQDKSHPGSGGGATFVYRSANKHVFILVAGGEGVVGKKMVYLGTIHRMAVVPLTREVLTGVVVRFVEMQNLYHTLGLGLVILITGVALKMASIVGQCTVVKGEFLWVKVEKVP